MGCISGIAKYLLFLFNFIIVICAIILISIGAIIIVNENKGIETFTDFSVGGFAIAVAVIILIIAFFGCCGAIKENNCMLTTYAIILILLLILQVVLGTLAFISIRNDDKKLDDEVEKAVKKLFDDYQDNKNDKEKREVIDTIQKDFECCGVEGPSYWTAEWGEIPESCYEDSDSKKKLYSKGCAKAFQDALTHYIKIIAWVAIIFAIVEFVGAVFACIVKNRS